VFYYKDSAEGKLLAEDIQAQLIEKADPENTRVIKANDSYYMLKKTSVPIVIVECGFLSNREETEKLCTAEYQDRIAWAVHMGIVRYLEEQK
jgi:N-acetylmuramoyl-L-alanine amidase